MGIVHFVIECIIFDLDGTLIDSEKLAADLLLQAFSTYGVSLNDEDAHAIVGRTWKLAFEILLSKYRLPVPPEAFAREVLTKYQAALRNSDIEIHGAAIAVKRLATEFPLALVSGSHRTDIEFALKKLGIFDSFQYVLGFEDYPRSKPAPDGFERALQLLKVSGSQALVFEDSPAGIQSGRAAGCYVCAITAAHHRTTSVVGAHAVISDWKEMSPQRIRELERENFK